jgi:hypothetical protein
MYQARDGSPVNCRHWIAEGFLSQKNRRLLSVNEDFWGWRTPHAAFCNSPILAKNAPIR